MAEGFDDIEMRNTNMEEEKEDREDEEGETSFGGDDPEDREEHNRSIDIINTENPKSKFSRVYQRAEWEIPDDEKGIRVPVIKKSSIVLINERKKSFKEIFKIRLEKKNGENNTILLEKTEFVRNEIFFEGKKIGYVNSNKEPELFTRKNKKYVDEFNDYMKKAKKEYEKTAVAFVEQNFSGKAEEPDWDYSPEFGNGFFQDVIQNSSERLNDSIEDLKGNLRENMKEGENGEAGASTVTEQDIRELNGVLKPKGSTPKTKIEALEIQADHWRQKALLETDEQKEQWYKEAEKLTRLVVDKLRLDNDIRPEEEETISIIQQEIEESELGRLEKFKQWAKENLVGLSAVSISVAGIITAIVISARNVLKQGAKAVGNLGRAIANIGKNFGVVISAVLNLISQILSWGAKGIAFLAKNLWILVIAITYFLYNEYKEYRKGNKY